MDVMKGNFGFTIPTALNALIIAVATLCSRYPSIGREVTGMGCFRGGSFVGSTVTS